MQVGRVNTKILLMPITMAGRYFDNVITHSSEVTTSWATDSEWSSTYDEKEVSLMIWMIDFIYDLSTKGTKGIPLSGHHDAAYNTISTIAAKAQACAEAYLREVFQFHCCQSG